MPPSTVGFRSLSGAAGHPADLGGTSARRLDARVVSLIGLAVFIAASVIGVTSLGVPLSREVISLWVLTGLLAVSLADMRGWARGVIFDWLPFIAALFAYDALRGLVGNNPIFEPHVLPQIRFDEWLFGGLIPTVELQASFYDPERIAWWDVASWAIYLTHFFMVFVIAAVLWRLARPRFLEFRAMVLALAFSAFATYALFPAVPPWMASDDGFIGPVSRTIGGVWNYLGVKPAAAIFDRGSSFSNEVAALPSLHTAYPVLILCFFWSRGGWVRNLCLAYAVAMSVMLVYTGEHYVFDVILGWIYAIVVFFAVKAIRGRLARRRDRKESEADLGEANPAFPDPVRQP